MLTNFPSSCTEWSCLENFICRILCTVVLNILYHCLPQSLNAFIPLEQYFCHHQLRSYINRHLYKLQGNWRYYTNKIFMGRYWSMIYKLWQIMTSYAQADNHWALAKHLCFVLATNTVTSVYVSCALFPCKCFILPFRCRMTQCILEEQPCFEKLVFSSSLAPARNWLLWKYLKPDPLVVSFNLSNEQYASLQTWTENSSPALVYELATNSLLECRQWCSDPEPCLSQTSYTNAINASVFCSFLLFKVIHHYFEVIHLLIYHILKNYISFSKYVIYRRQSSYISFWYCSSLIFRWHMFPFQKCIKKL